MQTGSNLGAGLSAALRADDGVDSYKDIKERKR